MSSKKLTTGPFRWTHKINNVNFLSNLQLKNKEESKKGVNTPPSLQDSAHPPVNAGTRLPSQSNNYFRRQHNTKWDVSVLYTCTFTEQKKRFFCLCYINHVLFNLCPILPFHPWETSFLFNPQETFIFQSLTKLSLQPMRNFSIQSLRVSW